MTMLNNVICGKHIYIACGYTDLRKGIDGLAAIVERSFDLDPCENSIFFFCGRRGDRVKVLLWDENGFILLYKRLEEGSFRWPRQTQEAKQITPQQFRWLMEGLSVDQKHALKPVKGVTFT